MTDHPYTKREQDMRYDSLHEKLDEIINKVDYTNGKVKKITLGLVGVGAFAIGLGLVEGKALLGLIL